MPDDPDDLQARMKGLVAGERGRGFVEVTPPPPPPAKDPLEELRELLRRKKPRRAKSRSRSSKR
jgi:hypothetical protein